MALKSVFLVSNTHKGVNRQEKQALQSCAVYQEQLFNLCGTFMVCLALRLWSHFSMASRWFWTLPNHLFRYWSENCADAKFIRTLDEWRGGCTLEHGGVVHSWRFLNNLRKCLTSAQVFQKRCKITTFFFRWILLGVMIRNLSFWELSQKWKKVWD